MKELESAVIEILGQLEAPTQSSRQSQLEGSAPDVHVDSLIAVEVILSLEDRFNVEFPDNTLTPISLRSVRDFCKRLRRVAQDLSLPQGQETA